MAGTATEGTNATLYGTMRIPRTDTAQIRNIYDMVEYFSGTPTGAAGTEEGGFVNEADESVLATFDITGLKTISIQINNRSDEDIDAGGVEGKAMDVFIDLSNDPDFANGVVPLLDDTTLASGADITYVFGKDLRGWTENGVNTWDWDGSGIVTVIPDGYPFKYMRISLQAETDGTPTYFEIRVLGLPN